MPRVTDIRAQKNGRFYSVFLDGAYGFSLGDLELSASNLRVGTELSAHEVENWQKDAGTSKVRNLALKYLAIRPRSVLEVRQYLDRKQAVEDAIEDTLQWLIDLKYLDDADFARRWIEHRHMSHRSTIKIKAELRQKGIEHNLIDEMLGSEPEANLVALRELIQKRRHRYSDDQKLIQYLARQGFRWSDIQKSLQEDD